MKGVLLMRNKRTSVSQLDSTQIDKLNDMKADFEKQTALLKSKIAELTTDLEAEKLKSENIMNECKILKESSPQNQ